MVKILVLNPVATKTWDKITLEYLERVACPQTEVHVKSLDEGVESIETEYDRDVNAKHVVREVVKAEEEGFDAVVINCFDDPGLHSSRERASILVLGIGETSILTALNLGLRVAIISTGRNAKALYYKKVLELGLEKRVSYTGGVDIEVLDMRRDVDRLKKLVVDEARRAIEDFNAEVIVLGCGGFLGLAEDIEREVKVPVVDPTLTTFKIAESLATLKLRHSKAYLYNPPIHKVRMWSEN